MANSDQQRKGAAELVKRARLYDQNAMGMLAEIAENARNGDPKAQSGLAEVRRYITAHPTETPLSDAARETLGVLREPGNPPQAVMQALSSLPKVGCKDDVFAAIVLLALCQPVGDEKWVGACAEASGPAREIFLFAIESAGDEDQMTAARQKVGRRGTGILCAGHCVGMARRLVAAATGDSAALGPDIAWEMGCG